MKLGESADEIDELDELHAKAKKKKWDEEVEKQF